MPVDYEWSRRPYNANYWRLRGPIVVPVSNADELIRRPRLIAFSTNITGAGAKTLIIPQRNERFWLKRITVEHEATGYNLKYLKLNDSRQSIMLNDGTIAATNDSLDYDFQLPFCFEYPWSIQITATDFAGAGTMYTAILCDEEPPVIN